MYKQLLTAALSGYGMVNAIPQGEGLGYPPPPPEELTMTMSGVLPVAPPGFTGVAIEEGAIIYDGPANPTFTPVNGPATTQASLPAATYQAVLPDTNFDNGTGSTITGSITISSSPGIPGVSVNVDFHGFPAEAEYGPFVYHIHAFPVPADGNCSATVGHLDPTDRGEYYPCNVAAPDTCQVGDLAGKHGNITTPDFTAAYADPFLSTVAGDPSFFGDKSIVIHSSNTTRLTCANFMMMGGNSTSGSPTASGTGAAPGYPTQSVIPQTGMASGNAASFGLVAAIFGVAAFFM